MSQPEALTASTDPMRFAPSVDHRHYPQSLEARNGPPAGGIAADRIGAERCICSGGGNRLLRLHRALARRGDRAGAAGRVARLRVRLRHPHRRPRVADGPDRLRAGHEQRSGSAPGVVPIYTRTPATMAQTAATIDELSGGRLTLGLGVSHRPVVEGWHGQTIDRPVAEMREYVAIVRAILRGEDPPGGREVADRLPPARARPAPAAADLHRRPLARDAAAGRRDRRRRDAVALQPRATSATSSSPR